MGDLFSLLILRRRSDAAKFRGVTHLSLLTVEVFLATARLLTFIP